VFSLAGESCGYVRKILNACDNIRSVANKRTTCWKPAAPVRRFLHPSQSRSPNQTKATKNMVRELRPCTSLSLSRGHLDTCVDAWARGQAVVELVEERGLGRAMLACCSSRFLGFSRQPWAVLGQSRFRYGKECDFAFATSMSS